jgi:peptide deformylase
VPDEWIRQWGDPVLRLGALPVRAADDVLKRQVARMTERLRDAEGAGLAATQVGFLRRLFVFRVDEEDQIEVLINPHVVDASQGRCTFIESCLSFNTVVVAVERPDAVRVEAQDLEGRSSIREFEGFGASLVQHEIDHLDGILTLDRANSAERWRAVKQLLDQAQTATELAA